MTTRTKTKTRSSTTTRKKATPAKSAPAKSAGPRSPEIVDEHVGARVRLRRAVLGLSQEELSDQLGITFQQIQKYERGANRISASRLFHIAQVLGVGVEYFFDGFNPDSPGRAYGFSDTAQDNFEWLEHEDGDLMERRETIDLIRTYYSVQDETVRRSFVKMLKALVESQNLRG